MQNITDTSAAGHICPNIRIGLYYKLYMLDCWYMRMTASLDLSAKVG